MRIERLSAKGFGTLSDVDLNFAPGITVIFGPNEAGKSTLVELLFALLYGPHRPDTKRAMVRAELAAKRPWAGGAFSGSVVVALGGRRLLIERDFSKPKEMSVRDLDLGTDLSRNYQPARMEFGPQALGLSADGFRSTALVRQGASADLSADESLLVRLQNLRESGEEEVSLSAARSRLEGALTTLGRSDRPGKSTEIGRLAERLSEVEARLVAARQERDRFLQAQLELDRRKEALAGAQRRAEELSGRLLGLRRHVWSRELDQRRRLEEELSKVGDELAALEPFRAFHPELAERAERTVAEAERELADAKQACAKAGEEMEAARREEAALPFRDLQDDALEGLELEGREVLSQRAQFEASLAEGQARVKELSAQAEGVDMDEGARKSAWGLRFSLLSGVFLLLALGLFVRSNPGSGAAALGVAAILFFLGRPFWAPQRRQRLRRRQEARREAAAQLEEARRQVADLERQRATLEERFAAFEKACGEALADDVLERLHGARRMRASLASRKQAAAGRLEAANGRVSEAEARTARAREEVAALKGRFGAFDAAHEASRRLSELDGRRQELKEELAQRRLPDGSRRAAALEGLVADGVQEVPGSPADLEALEEEAAALNRSVESQRAALESLEATLSGLKDTGRSLPELAAELRQLEDRMDVLKRRRNALSEALRALEAVSDAYHKEVSPKLNRRVEQYVAAVTGGDQTIVVGTTLAPQISEGGPLSLRSAEDLSQGMRDALYLALRLALLELMSEGQPLPMILDDPFVTLDRLRFSRLLPLLQQASEDRQVVVLTCHEREAEAFEKAGAAVLGLGSGASPQWRPQGGAQEPL